MEVVWEKGLMEILDRKKTAKPNDWNTLSCRSFGVLLWEIFSLGYMPYPGRGNQDVMQLVTNGGRLDAPSNCPELVYNIMKMCWHPHPQERPTFSQIIELVNSCIQVIQVNFPKHKLPT